MRILFLYSSLLVFLIQTNAALAQEKVWEGTWDTNFGEIRLKQSGNSVFGDYSNVGTMKGTYNEKGKVLSGTFNNNGRKGRFKFVYTGDSFYGKWAWEEEALKPKWTGTRSSSKTPLLVNTAKSIAAANDTKIPEKEEAKSYLIDLKRFCIQNHDEGWGKEEANVFISIYKGGIGKPLTKVGRTVRLITDSDPARNVNLRRMQGGPLVKNGKVVKGVKLDRFEVAARTAYISIKDVQKDEFILVHAFFVERDGDYDNTAFEREMEEKLIKPNYRSRISSVRNPQNDLDIIKRAGRDYIDGVKVNTRRYFNDNKVAHPLNALSRIDPSDLIGSDVGVYVNNPSHRWVYATGDFLRLEGKNDDAHYFIEFKITEDSKQ